MTATVTEFKVPLAGIPITISRTYDSLERNLIQDFGYGWRLNTTVGLSVDSHMNVTFDFDGQRHDQPSVRRSLSPGPAARARVKETLALAAGSYPWDHSFFASRTALATSGTVWKISPTIP